MKLVSPELQRMLNEHVDAFCAAHSGVKSVVASRLASAADMNVENVLLSAAYMNDVPLARASVQEGADLNTVPVGNSINSIQLAAKMGHEDMFRFLAISGAKMTAEEFADFPAVFVERYPSVFAAVEGRSGILRMMKDEFAVDLSLEHSLDRKTNFAPLPHVAAMSGAYADPERKIATLTELHRQQVDFLLPDRAGNPLLHNMYREWRAAPEAQGDAPLKYLVGAIPALVGQKDGEERDIFELVARSWEHGKGFALSLLEGTGTTFAAQAQEAARRADNRDLGAIARMASEDKLKENGWLIRAGNQQRHTLDL